MAINLGELRDRLRARRTGAPSDGVESAAPRIALLVLGVLAMAGVFGTFIFWQQYRTAVGQMEALRAEAQERIFALEQDNASVRARAAQAEAKQQDLQQRWMAVNEELASVKQELGTTLEGLAQTRKDRDKSRQQYEELAAEVEALRIERNRLEEELDGLNSERNQLGRSVTSLQEAIGTLKRDKSALNDEVDRLQAAVKLSARVDSPRVPPVDRRTVDRGAVLEEIGPARAGQSVIALPPIIVQHPARDAAKSPDRGRVISVNDEHRFVVINQGSLNGIEPGSTLLVYRGTEPVGRIRAARVRETITACDVTSSSARLHTGDVVVLSRE